MASEIRVNTINNRSGLGTISITNSGAVFSGVTTFAQIKTTSGEVTVGTGASVFSPATNVLALGTNNTEKVRITSTGSVGIGTDNPDRKLESVDTANSLTYPVAVSNHTSASTGVGAAIDFRLASNGVTRGELGLVYAGNNNSDGTDFVLKPNDGSTGNIERLRIKGSNGNIGIGTDNPSQTLDVNGNVLIRKSNNLYFETTSGFAPRLTNSADQNSLSIFTNNTEKLRIDANGNVGINKTPETDWSTAYRALEIGNSSVSAYQGGTYPSIELNMNCRGTSASYGAGWKYISAGERASQIQLPYSGEIEFKHSAVGANAGDPITWVRSARFTNTGNLEFPSGQGISFSATANSSGSMTSELLDDYEEGTWTPQITQGVSGTPTYQFQLGWYTKIGRIVTLYFYLRFNSSGNTGSNTSMRIGNFPFPVASNYQNTYNRGMGVSNYHSIPGFTSGNISFYGGGSSNTFATMYLGNQGVLTSSSLNSVYVIGGFEYISE